MREDRRSCPALGPLGQAAGGESVFFIVIRIVGWKLASHMRTDLVLLGLQMAFARRTTASRNSTTPA